MWFMFGLNTRMWTGIFFRYLIGGGEWEEVFVGFRDLGFGLSGFEVVFFILIWVCIFGVY